MDSFQGYTQNKSRGARNAPLVGASQYYNGGASLITAVQVGGMSSTSTVYTLSDNSIKKQSGAESQSYLEAGEALEDELGSEVPDERQYKYGG